MLVPCPRTCSRNNAGAGCSIIRRLGRLSSTCHHYSAGLAHVVLRKAFTTGSKVSRMLSSESILHGGGDNVLHVLAEKHPAAASIASRAASTNGARSRACCPQRKHPARRGRQCPACSRRKASCTASMHPRRRPDGASLRMLSPRSLRRFEGLAHVVLRKARQARRSRMLSQRNICGSPTSSKSAPSAWVPVASRAPMRIVVRVVTWFSSTPSGKENEA